MATEYCFTVNGMRRTTTEKKSLLRYLRDDLHLFSVKDGCSEGACGTCTIIVDGVAVKACVLTTDKSVGRNGRGTDRKRAGCICLCIWFERFCTVWFLHSGNGYGRKSTY